MVQNLFILTGENDYQLHVEKMRWKSEFTRKHGNENLLCISGADVSVRSLLDEVSVMPFLAEKRLVIAEGIVRCSKEEARSLHANIHPNVLLLFIDPKPDKRSAGIKELLELAGKNAKNLPMLKGVALSKWADLHALQLGGVLNNAARSLLLEWNGQDQGMLSQEIGKLLLVAKGTPVTVALVEQFCTPSDAGIIWTISDHIYAGSRDKALLYAHRMLDRGSDPYGLWSMLLSLVHNVVAVRAAFMAHVSVSQLAAEAKIQPFVVQSMSRYCTRLHDNDVYELLRWAATEEIRLKTGSYRASKDDKEEILSLIDALLLRIP